MIADKKVTKVLSNESFSRVSANHGDGRPIFRKPFSFSSFSPPCGRIYPTKVKVPEDLVRWNVVIVHMTSNPPSASSFSPGPSRYRRPRCFRIPVCRAKRYHLTGRSNLVKTTRPSWNRVTLRHACHVIAVRCLAARARFFLSFFFSLSGRENRENRHPISASLSLLINAIATLRNKSS